MLKSIIRRILLKYGIQVHRASVKQRNRIAWTHRQDFIDKIISDPLDPEYHYQYALEALEYEMPFLAYAEFKTALCLGLKRGNTKHMDVFDKALPELKHMNHNQYFRFESLAREIKNQAGSSDISVLDIGGGSGELAAFIPEYSYCLVEPNVNGIDGSKLPFFEKSFDYAVACHVLEHIPAGNEREFFLDQLLSRARKGVILLNPFYIEGSFVEERLNLFIDITGEQWAKEHLACELPRLEEIKGYAQSRGLVLNIKPNGALVTSMALVFMDYFAKKAQLQSKWEMVNHFINEKYFEAIGTNKIPNGYVVCLNRNTI